jgi:hypothetical protein
MIYTGKTYYGGYRTRTFQEIWESAADFANFMNEECDIPNQLSQENTDLLYYLLYARFGNTPISGSDENQFRYGVAATAYMYGPTWQKRLFIQDKLRSLSEEDLLRGARAIHNQALNPGTQVGTGTATYEELPGINQQSTSNYKKSKMEGYGTLMALLDTDVSREFIDKFAQLFVKVAAPDYPLLYDFSYFTGEEEGTDDILFLN